MSTKDKFEITKDIIVSVMANTNMHAIERLEAVPDAFEKIYTKLDELDKNSSKTNDDTFSNSYDESNVF